MSKEDNTNYIPRSPIVLSHNTIALLHIFEKDNKLSDLWIMDTDWVLRQDYKDSAKQFISQLEDHWCDAFLEEMILEMGKMYKESRSRCTDGEEDFNKLKRKFNDL